MRHNQVDLAPQSSLKIGGRAQVLFRVSDLSELKTALAYAEQQQCKPLIVGRLTNILLPDGDLPLVIQLQATQTPLPLTTNQVTVWAGETMTWLAQQTIQANLAGLQVFHSLPGTVGGAIWNNAHFDATLLSDVLTSVTFYDLTTQTWQTKDKSALDFAYDHSYFQTHPSVIANATFTLQANAKPQQLLAQARQALKKRQACQPLTEKSLGCFFQNPPNTPALKRKFKQFRTQSHLSAGFLIDQAGLKGQRVGDAQVSNVHAAFIINRGHATSAQVRTLEALIQKTVQAKFGITLQPEVTIIPEPPLNN
jgi:UDP-N-acetylmuramate dehydrogenase